MVKGPEIVSQWVPAHSKVKGRSRLLIFSTPHLLVVASHVLSEIKSPLGYAVKLS